MHVSGRQARLTVIRLYVPRSEEDVNRNQPSIRSLGAAVYAKYVLTMSLIFCTLVFMIKRCRFQLPQHAYAHRRIHPADIGPAVCGRQPTGWPVKRL